MAKRKHSRAHIRHHRERVIHNWIKFFANQRLSDRFVNFPPDYRGDDHWEGCWNRYSKFPYGHEQQNGDYYWNKITHHPRYSDERMWYNQQWKRDWREELKDV